jgi:hypothetical protein
MSCVAARARQKSWPRGSAGALRGGGWSLAGADELFGDVGLALQPGKPQRPYIGTTRSPRPNRCRITAITSRLAATFCASAPVGRRFSPARISSSVRSG